MMTETETEDTHRMSKR